MREAFGRWQRTLARVALMPVSFLGVGLYRAWLAIFFRYGAYPTLGVADYALFEVSIGVACIAAACAHRRLSPLWRNGHALRGAALAMTLGAAGCAVDAFLASSSVLRAASLVLAGIGLAVAILAWCEFYSALNPMRVALYHAAGIFFGELICWFFMAVMPAGLVGMSLVLPALSLWWVHVAAGKLPEADRPQANAPTAGKTLPWKPILLMATCTFATGFATLPDQPLVMGNVAGALFACALVFFGSLSSARWFNFDVIYRLAFPLMSACLLLALPLLGRSPQVAAACFDAGYTMLSMFIMIILSNITYRFGINAVWLNGVERGIRYIVEAAGWGTFEMCRNLLTPQANTVVHAVVMTVVVAMFLVVVLQEKSLAARWGIDLHAQTAEDDIDAFSPGQLSLRVSDLSRRFGLSDREEEVLQLMVRGAGPAQMEEQLFVARGTIKAHTAHVYKKCGVRGKEELFELLGIGER